MAEITVGAVVLGIINALTQESVRTSHAWLSKNSHVRAELERIREDFTTIQSLLWTVDRADTEGDQEVVGPWASRIRSAAHEVEDIVDDYLHFISGMHAGFRKGILHGVKLYHFVSEIAHRLEKVGPKVREICQSGDRLAVEHIIKNRMDSSSSSGGNSNGRLKSSGHTPEVDQSPVGTAENEKLLLSWLWKEAKNEGNDVWVPVIVVTGMGGLGKTTLALKVYKDPRVSRRFNFRAWVSVSSIRDAESFWAAILEHMLNCDDTLRKEETVRADIIKSKEEVIGKIRELLQIKENRCVIVLDDAREATLRFDLLKEIQVLLEMLTSSNFYNRILITTRDRNIISVFADKGSILELQPLEQGQAWSLFCRIAFSSAECPINLEGYTSKMVDGCGGLPLAIVAVGSMMSTKGKDPVTWDRSVRNLTFVPSSRVWGDLSPLYNSLVPSFYDLPYQQRQCFFYLAAYPDGRPISRKSLVRLWVAEGFVKGREELTAEEVAEEYLLDLVCRSMIVVVSWNEFGRMRTCKLHDVVRKIALTIINRQRLFTVLSRESTSTDFSRFRRLSVHGYPKEALQNEDFEKLRSLIVFDNDCFNDKRLTRFAGTLKLLKVLDLKGAPIKSIPGPFFDLFSLIYLSLRETKISYKVFPRYIKRLRSLETLDLWKTEVEALPRHVYKLTNLRHLICGSGHKPVKLGYRLLGTDNNGIWNLTNLQTLKNVEADDKMASGIGNLRQLRTLFISNVNRSHEIPLNNCISHLKKLMRLTIKVGQGFSFRLENAVPPPLLQKLEISGKLRGDPTWLGGFRSLRHMSLFESELQASPLSSIPHFHLVFLCLWKTCNEKELSFLPSLFSELKILYLKDLPVTRIVIHERSLPSLRTLYICCCKALNSVPKIENLKGTLKDIRLQEPTPHLKAGLEKICQHMSEVVIRHIGGSG